MIKKKRLKKKIDISVMYVSMSIYKNYLYAHILAIHTMSVSIICLVGNLMQICIAIACMLNS